jgi:hypothetical protein
MAAVSGVHDCSYRLADFLELGAITHWVGEGKLVCIVLSQVAFSFVGERSLVRWAGMFNHMMWRHTAIARVVDTLLRNVPTIAARCL